MNASRWTSAGLTALAVAVGAGYWLQREESRVLQSEVDLLRHDQRTLANLRLEQARLLAAQVPPEELARLRADRAALIRLRGEIEAMQARIRRAGP